MTAREEAEELREEAINKLLEERKAIDEELKLLGYGQELKTPTKRRGRPPKATLEDGQQVQIQADSTERQPPPR